MQLLLGGCRSEEEGEFLHFGRVARESRTESLLGGSCAETSKLEFCGATSKLKPPRRGFNFKLKLAPCTVTP